MAGAGLPSGGRSSRCQAQGARGSAQEGPDGRGESRTALRGSGWGGVPREEATLVHTQQGVPAACLEAGGQDVSGWGRGLEAGDSRALGEGGRGWWWSG